MIDPGLAKKQARESAYRLVAILTPFLFIFWLIFNFAIDVPGGVTDSGTSKTFLNSMFGVLSVLVILAAGLARYRQVLRRNMKND
ncbi:hypothetical protein HYS84_03430 [Candidatus Saccharibacteria bacterium]|nr:hypothetical protein [Candidatus Saccharibacteria bacterium]